jgi:hypothetical protein
VARIIDFQTNIWGKQGGIDAQRSDQWVVDFTQALTGLSTVVSNTAQISTGQPIPYVPPKLASFFVASVTLPELKIRAEAVRRDSRNYQMPSLDEPCDTVRLVFILDCFKPGANAKGPYQSDIYQMLNTWRTVVRAGRGGLSTEFSIALDAHYRIDYAYDVRLLLMRSSSNIQVANNTADQSPDESIMNDLEISTQLRLVNCWLSSFKISELAYEQARVVQLESIFYAEDIRNESDINNTGG